MEIVQAYSCSPTVVAPLHHRPHIGMSPSLITTPHTSAQCKQHHSSGWVSADTRSAAMGEWNGVTVTNSQSSNDAPITCHTLSFSAWEGPTRLRRKVTFIAGRNSCFKALINLPSDIFGGVQSGAAEIDQIWERRVLLGKLVSVKVWTHCGT